MGDAIKAVFLDLSGVLYDGDDLIAGALDAVNTLRKRGLALRFVTNTATRDGASILAKLRGMGFELADADLFTAPMAARAYLDKHGLRPYALVHPSIEGLFGIGEDQKPNCVVLGDARDGLNYASLNRAFQICSEGAPLIAIGYNRYFKNAGELWLDAGAFVKAIEWAAGVEAVIAGKPGREFFNQVVASTPYAAEACLMVGDDLEGDVIGALDAGLQACQVRTGKFRETDIERLPENAQRINSIADLPERVC